MATSLVPDVLSLDNVLETSRLRMQKEAAMCAKLYAVCDDFIVCPSPGPIALVAYKLEKQIKTGWK